MQRPIYINGRYATRPITGVERYATDICRILGDRAQLIQPPRYLKGAAGHVWEQSALPGMIPAEACLWSPANTGPLAVSAQALTIHDLAALDHAESYRSSFAAGYQFLLPRLARRVRKIIAVSAFTRSRICERFNLPEDRVAVIPAGVDLDYFKPARPEEMVEVRERYSLERQYLLFVGTLQPRKNLKRLLGAWNIVAERLPGVDLVLVGGTSRSFRNAGILPLPAKVRALGRVDDRDLPAIYSGALGVVIPSVYEGFCLVGLEGLACGSVVAAADIPAFRETLGDAAQYFDPYSVEEMAEVLQFLLEDHGVRRRMRSSGVGQIERFRLERIAAEILRVLNEI